MECQGLFRKRSPETEKRDSISEMETFSSTADAVLLNVSPFLS